MKILMVASEATPYAKTGGLADVIGALPAALAAAGEQVAVALPLYPSAQPFAAGADRVLDGLHVYLTPQRSYRVNIHRIHDRGVQIFFVECPELFDRPQLYSEGTDDYADNHVRFGVFCRAALGIVRALFRPDVIHCHDWQAALVPVLMKKHFRTDPTFTGIQTLFTIHNLGYQGLFPREALDDLGMSKDLFHPDRLEFWGRVNLMKGAIICSDAISTVSRTYAKEIQTEELGFGLDGLLRSRADVLTGIVNGVDYNDWSPDADGFIAAKYSAVDMSGKEVCRRDLLRSFGLPEDERRPVVGMVSRFVSQKGFDLIEQVADRMMESGIVLTALGTGDPQYEEMMRSLAERYPGQAAVHLGYSNDLAHKVEAGSDLFLMPSQYEPCGLNQIYSLRYGTLPVVRATGGLEDTIDESVGFKFSEYTGEALLEALGRALAAYRDRDRWSTMRKAAMRKDYSWAAVAGEYRDLYRRLTATAQLSASAG